MLTNRNINGVWCVDKDATPVLTAIKGVKTTGLLMIDGNCVGRFDSAGISRGDHQIIVVHDQAAFLQCIEELALKGTKVTCLAADGESEHTYRVGA